MRRLSPFFCCLIAACAVDPLPGSRSRPFHYCRFEVGDGPLRCDVMMLQEDGSWKRVDGF